MLMSSAIAIGFRLPCCAEMCRSLCVCVNHFQLAHAESETCATERGRVKPVCFVAGKWQGQRAKAVEKALLGKTLDVDTLIKALQALPQDLRPTPTPGTPHWAPVNEAKYFSSMHAAKRLCSSWSQNLKWLQRFGILLHMAQNSESHDLQV